MHKKPKPKPQPTPSQTITHRPVGQVISSARSHRLRFRKDCEHEHQPGQNPLCTGRRYVNRELGRYRSLEIQGRPKWNASHNRAGPRQKYTTIEPSQIAKQPQSINALSRQQTRNKQPQIWTHRQGSNSQRYDQSIVGSARQIYCPTNASKKKKTRRYLTQVSDHESRGKDKSFVYKKGKQQIMNGNCIGQISQIVQQPIHNTKDGQQQLSILSHIGHLDKILHQLQTQPHNQQNEDINNPTPQVQEKFPQTSAQPINVLGLNIFRHRSKKTRNRLKQLKNNTLIMRSIDKIRHRFPKGFFCEDSLTEIP